MRNHTFKVRIEGEGVSPSSVSARDVFETIVNIETALSVTAHRRFGSDPNSEESRVSLVGIGEGSDTLTIAVSEPLQNAARLVTNAIASDDFESIPREAYPSIKNLSKIARKREWNISFLPEDGGNGIVPAVIQAARPILVEAHATGRTTLYGKCERVGGDNPTAQILFLSGERKTIRLRSTELAQSLGTKLYKIVGLIGEAKWDPDDLELESFVADSLTEFEDFDRAEASPVTKAFTELAEAAGGRWDDIDPDEYVQALRNEEAACR